jgi:hypothetical protein
MRLAPEDDALARRALDKVVERANAAHDAADIEAAIANLMSTRDAIIGAVSTLRALSESTRARAIKSLESA